MAIARDDREALLERVLFAPIPRSVSDRYTPLIRKRARELHESFWETRHGPPSPAEHRLRSTTAGTCSDRRPLDKARKEDETCISALER